MRHLVLAMAALVASEALAEACTCIGPVPACQATWQADAVFVARVVAIAEAPPDPKEQTPWRNRRVQVRVTEAFRGVASREVDVFTGTGGGDCGYNFGVGGDYLIYAYRHPQNGRLSTGICSRTRSLSAAGDDLKYLRGPAREASTRARIFGTLERVDPSDHWPPPRTPLADVRVTAEGDQRVYRARTRSDGSYEMPVLAGKYTVTFDLPEELYVYAPIPTEVKDLRGCAEVSAAARWNGRVIGRVVSEAGDPVPGLAVGLIAAATGDRAAFDAALQVRTDAEGRYEISRIPDGVYHVSFDSWRAERDRADVRRAIMEEAASSFALQVSRGERVAAADLVLPRGLALVEVSGIVLGPTGAPATEVRVYLKADSNSYYPLPPEARTDKDGRFVTTVIAGRRYRLSAEGYEKGRYASRAELAGFEAKDDLKGLTIQLKPLEQGGS
jgi:5-hydroxyisourate hydrolase-like protein (transthyretin family)